jgi:hypothetical protein
MRFDPSRAARSLCSYDTVWTSRYSVPGNDQKTQSCEPHSDAKVFTITYPASLAAMQALINFLLFPCNGSHGDITQQVQGGQIFVWRKDVDSKLS